MHEVRAGFAPPTTIKPQQFSALEQLGVIVAREHERLFLWVPVCFAAGIGCYFSLSFEPDVWAALAVAVAALILRVLARAGGPATILATALLVAAAGFFAVKARVESVRAPVLDRNMPRAEIEGTIEAIEPRGERAERLTLRQVAIAGLAPAATPAKVRVRVPSAPATLASGDRVKLTATLRPPSRPAFPGDFDFARTAYFQQIGGDGYGFKAPEVLPRNTEKSLRQAFWDAVEELRDGIGARVAAALPGETGSIAQALITGERGAISAETNAAYRDSGLFHILSISGLHMVIMAGSVFYATRLFLALIPPIALRADIKKWAAVCGSLGAVGYLLISGGSYATVRAAITILIMFAAILVDRPAISLRNVALAALAILLIFPESLLDIGFQMSFAAVVALVSVHEEVTRRLARGEERGRLLRVALFFGGIVASTIIASLAVAPFAAYHFHKTQQFAILANLAAIPICNFLVMPAALLTLVLMPFGLEALALWPMAFGIDLMTACARWVGTLPGAVGRIPAIPAVSFELMVAGGLWLTLWRTRWRLLGLPLALGGAVLAPTGDRPDIIVARGGALVAVRGPDGLLSALPAAHSRFDLTRWLERDGDERKPADVQKATAFSCDGIGCTSKVAGVLLTVSLHPASVDDDCARGRIVVLLDRKPSDCTVPKLVIEGRDVWRQGTHALYADASGGFEVVTVESIRAGRPWSDPLRRVTTQRPFTPALGPGMRRSARDADTATTPADPAAELPADDPSADVDDLDAP